MDIKDIVKNAPEGATHYKLFEDDVEYYKKANGAVMFFGSYLREWNYSMDIRNFKDSTPLPTRTKVEYVEICPNHDWHAWEYLKEYSSGDSEWFYKVMNDKLAPVIEWFNVAECVRQGKALYRRIEIPITERDEFIEKVGDILPVFDKRTNPMWAGKLYDAGCRFVGE